MYTLSPRYQVVDEQVKILEVDPIQGLPILVHFGQLAQCLRKQFQGNRDVLYFLDSMLVLHQLHVTVVDVPDTLISRMIVACPDRLQQRAA